MSARPPRTPLVEAVDPSVLAEARAFNDGLERILATQPSVHTLPPAIVRRARREGRSIFPPPVFLPEARELTVPGRSGAIRLRILPTSREPRGIYLHLHGGGWMLGAADLEDVPLRRLADATGLVVASVEYRLAPEHPYPAGPDDCEDAALWLVEHGAKELGTPARLAIGGESAGAHLSVVTLLRLRDRHGIEGAFAAANVVFGAFDLSRTPSQRHWGDRNLVISDAINRFFGDAFLPGLDAEARRAPDVSPLYADLRAMPPALFTVGTVDPLLDDSLFLHARWRAAGIDADLKVWPEAIHGFTAFPIALATLANEAQYAYLAAMVGG